LATPKHFITHKIYCSRQTGYWSIVVRNLDPDPKDSMPPRRTLVFI